MTYSVEYDPQAISDLKKIPKPQRQRIVTKIDWLVANFENVQPLPLSANLTGFYKLRVGDYRVIYEVDRTVRIITVDRVGHRRDVYG
jgi:mRNA interferase RelE/StbE